MFNFQEESVFTALIPALPRYATGWIQRINEAVQGLVNRTKWLKDGLANKLDASAYNQYFKGMHTSELALNTAHPTADAGSYALVDVGEGVDALFYWFDVDDGWVTNGQTVSLASTDALVEGSTNLYYTNARVLTALLADKTPINVTKTASAVFDVADNTGKTIIRMAVATANTYQITTSLTKPITVRQADVGLTTLVEGSGVTLNGNLVFSGINDAKTIVPVSSGIYDVYGAPA